MAEHDDLARWRAQFQAGLAANDAKLAPLMQETRVDRVVSAIVAYWRQQHGGDYDHHGVHINDHARYLREIVQKAMQSP